MSSYMKKEERFSIDPSIIQQHSQQMDNELYYRERNERKEKKFFAEREKERDGNRCWSI